ncbi:MAG: ATP-binding protein, partial [Deltaproteobacteria bacterium]
MSDGEVKVPIRTDGDIVAARQRGRALALEIGLSSTDATLVATAISEIARNIVSYAR